MDFPVFKLIMLSLAVIGLAYTATFLVKLYQVRSRMLKLKSQGLPMPPYSPIFGHLLVCNDIMSKLPRDAHPQYLPDQLRRKFPHLGPNYYIDTWPFGPMILVVSSPSTLYQITQEHSLPKYHAVRSFLYPLTDGLDIVTMEGQTWKTWRSIYNPGFSSSNLMALVPEITRETSRFLQVLHKHVQENDIFPLKTHTDNLAMDVIGRVVLDTQLGSQQSSNTLVDALRSQIRWLTFGEKINPFDRFNPLRFLMHRYNAYYMNSYLSRELDRRFALYRKLGDRPSKCVIDLALETYVTNKPREKLDDGMDPTFKRFAMSQVKLFLFSGHDTTSSSICYIFYLLSVHGSVLKRVREEHSQVLGCSGLDQKIEMLEEDPFILNQIPYTVAVIKESLRLFPVVSSTRGGEPGFNVQDTEGRFFPTDGFLVWSISQALHRDPRYWPRPDDFLPERWLVSAGDPLYPIKGTWRPFEYGPRNCIGQELAMIEMKIAMIMALHEFDFEPAYAELDQQGSSLTNKSVDGERAYQVQLAQPSGDLPCRVRLAAR